MSTRYVRKEVPLEVRGISRASVEHHPLPERADGSSTATPTLPFTFVHSMSNAIENFDAGVKRREHGRLFASVPGPRRSVGSPSTSSSSSSSNGSSSGDSTVSAGGPVSGSGSAAVDWIVRCRGPGWAAENTTDRTSISSSDWGDDVCEFDRQESRRVRVMFEQIESMLFEASNAGPAHLYRECRHWNGRFPHIRLLGRQLLSPQDLGFAYHAMPADAEAEAEAATAVTVATAADSTTPPELPSPRHPFVTASPDTDSIFLVGQCLTPASPSPRLSDERPSCEEEILAQDGCYEEVIAIDAKITEEDLTEKKYLKRRRHRGYPPLTPNAVLRDSILSGVFDSVWSEIVGWMRPLLTENFNRNLQEQSKEEADILPVLPLTPTALPPYGTARGPSEGLVVRDAPFARRHLAPPPAGSNGDSTLASLLQISTKTLQARERSSLQDIPESPSVLRIMPPPPQPPRPGSSAPRAAQRPGSVRQEGSRVPSARTRGRGRLAPLDRTRTPFLEEEQPLRGGLRGRSLQLGNELVRSGTLPPLSFSALASHPVASSSRAQLSRIGSAVAQHDSSHKSSSCSSTAAQSSSGVRPSPLPAQPITLAVASPPGSNGAAVAVDNNRPSTTHTFRSDTPYGRRSSTPLGLRAGVLLNLGIHGNSIGAGSIVHHHLEEGDESEPTRPGHSGNWGSYPPSHSVSNPYRRGKQLGYIVR